MSALAGTGDLLSDSERSALDEIEAARTEAYDRKYPALAALRRGAQPRPGESRRQARDRVRMSLYAALVPADPGQADG